MISFDALQILENGLHRQSPTVSVSELHCVPVESLQFRENCETTEGDGPLESLQFTENCETTEGNGWATMKGEANRFKRPLSLNAEEKAKEEEESAPPVKRPLLFQSGSYQQEFYKFLEKSPDVSPHID